MSKVKFIQIGSDSLVYAEYKVKLDAALASYPGAIIFGTYYDATKKKTCQEIWANGKQYSVGAGSDARFYEGTQTPEAYFAEHTEFTPLHGDYYIKKSDLNGNASDNIEERTAYVYDAVNTVWVALSGNYDALNVYFPNGIDRTEMWGIAGVETDIQEEECKNMNLKDLFEHYLVKEKFPSTSETTANTSIPDWSISSNTKPSLSVLVSEGGAAATSGQTVEVGTEFFAATRTYDTTVTAKEGASTSVSNGTEKTYSLGPSTISGMKYGFWSKADHDANHLDASHLVKVQSVTFNGTAVSDSDSHTYTPNDTRQTASGTYAYVSSGTSEMKYAVSVFGEPYGSADSATDSGDSTLTLTGRKLTVGLGSNSIKLQVKNANYWTRTVEDNTIPATNVLYVATNKRGSRDYSGSEKSVKVNAVTVPAGEATKKVDNAGFSDKGTFTATGVYPVYSNGTNNAAKMGNISVVNHTTISTHPSTNPTDKTADAKLFEKSTPASTAYYFMVPASLGKPKVQVWPLSGVWSTWTPDGVNSKIERGISVDVNSNATGVEYTKVTVDKSNGLGVLYRIIGYDAWS